MTAQELAEKHWDYVRSVLEAHGADKEEIELIGFHYVTSFIHGYKHGQDEA